MFLRCTVASCRALLLCALLVAGCGGSGGERIVVSDARIEPNPDNALSATLLFSTSAPVVPVVEVVDPERGNWRVPRTGIESVAAGTEHRVAILGLRAERDYAFRIGGPGVQADRSLQLRTDPLPRDFPVVEVSAARPELASGGVTVFPLGEPFDLTGPSGWIIGVDTSGEPVWYHRPDPEVIPGGVTVLPGGLLAFLAVSWEEVRIVDMMGRPRATHFAHDLGLITFHHEPNAGRDGALLLISTEHRVVSGYPGDETLDLLVDVLVELSPEGQVLQRWSMLDVLAPHRIFPESTVAFLTEHYPDVEGMRDWSHVNSVWYDPEEDSFTVSARNQRIVFEMTREGELVWVLGEDSPETAEDDDWPWLRWEGPGPPLGIHHGVSLGEGGHVFIYDNAVGSLASRPVEIAIDEVEGVARLEWDWRDPDRRTPVLALVGGDVAQLPNGNVLVHDGINLDLRLWVTEVDPTTGEKALQVSIPGINGGYNVAHLPDLYPVP